MGTKVDAFSTRLEAALRKCREEARLVRAARRAGGDDTARGACLRPASARFTACHAPVAIEGNQRSSAYWPSNCSLGGNLDVARSRAPEAQNEVREDDFRRRIEDQLRKLRAETTAGQIPLQAEASSRAGVREESPTAPPGQSEPLAVERGAATETKEACGVAADAIALELSIIRRFWPGLSGSLRKAILRMIRGPSAA